MLIHLINADYMTENGGFIINEKMVFLITESKDLSGDGGSINLSNTASFVEEEDIEMDTRCVC